MAYNFNPLGYNGAPAWGQTGYNAGQPLYNQGQNYYNSPAFAVPAAPQVQNQIICRPVAGIDEVKNIPVDVFNTYLFADFGSNKIYYKFIGNDGLSVIKSFTLDGDNPAAAVQQGAAQGQTPAAPQSAAAQSAVNISAEQIAAFAGEINGKFDALSARLAKIEGRIKPKNREETDGYTTGGAVSADASERTES